MDDSGTVATTLADTQVLFDGVPSPMIFAGDGQVDAVVPFGVTADTTQVQVQYQGQASAIFSHARRARCRSASSPRTPPAQVRPSC